MSRHKVSRGNTSDLIGLWNNRAVTEVNKPNLLSVSPGNGINPKFRKTSAFVPATIKVDPVADEVKIRKASAMVLLPVARENSPVNRSLNVDDSRHYSDFKPLKTISGLEQGAQDLPKLRSALKLSTVEAPNSLDANNNRRGSVGLGRSKSVCHKVKFQPAMTSNEGRPPVSNSPFAKFQQMDHQERPGGVSSSGGSNSRLTRQASLPSLNEKKVSAPAPSIGGAATNLQSTNSSGGGLRRATVVARSPSSAKEVILTWVQERTNTYPNINVTNFSTCWNDGMAFCALIHYYYPEAFDFEKLDPKNKKYNFDLAFKTAEKYADICPLLDVEDMVMFEKPDWKCVFTYVQTFYRRFRNGRDPPAPTKKLTLTPPIPAPTINLAKSIE